MNTHIHILKAVVEPLVKADDRDITLRQLAVLLWVNDQATPPSVKHVAAAIGISKPAVTRALDRLQELTFVARGHNKTDARMIDVKMMLKGRAFIAQADKRIAAAIAKGAAPTAAPPAKVGKVAPATPQPAAAA
jgi:DNA-binding MarR family transcriptional regulator